MDKAPFYINLIADEMRQVDEVIARQLASEVPLVGQVATHIIQSGGKRLRPVLLLLMSQALQHASIHRHAMAAVIEFIHTATLLHDDVVDESTLRRGQKTANEVFGNAASVLVGDFLYSRAFQMMVDVGQMPVMQIVANATNVIAEGEVLQLMNMRDASLTQAQYLQVVESKTAKLFEASTRLPAVLAQLPSSVEASCAAYGRHLGVAFQIIDDVLDYEGDAKEWGKNLGDDLREGKVTLPMILALQSVGPYQKEQLLTAIQQEIPSDLGALVTIIQQSGALTQTRLIAEQHVKAALEAISSFADHPATAALKEIATASLVRRF